MGRKAITVAALIGLWILPVSAQSHGGSAGRAIASRSSGSGRSIRSLPVVVRPRPVTTRNSNTFVNPGLSSGYFPGGTIQDLFGYPVPGLGFDYVQYGAVNGNLGIRALIDPVTQQEIALALKLRGFGVGSYPYYFSPFAGAPIVLETPSAVAQPDAPAQPPIVVVAPPPAQPAAPPVAEEQPLPDPGEFVLVQRDGRLLFAVAFTSDAGRVVYITKEGLRRSIPLEQLDVEATLRMNEERGTSIQLPKT